MDFIRLTWGLFHLGHPGTVCLYLGHTGLWVKKKIKKSCVVYIIWVTPWVLGFIWVTPWVLGYLMGSGFDFGHPVGSGFDFGHPDGFRVLFWSPHGF